MASRNSFIAFFREQSFWDYIIILIMLAILSGLIVPPFYFERNKITALEIRYYIFIVLFILFLLTFAMLRLYNAIVGNTASNLALKNKFAILSAALSALTQSLSNKLTPLISAIHDLIKSTEENSKK